MISQEKADFIRTLADPDGYIEPQAIIAAAADPTCIIHDEFIWDDAQAASMQRLDQARTLIRFVRLEVRVERHTRYAPFYVVDPERPPKSQRYVELTRAAIDRSLARKILQDELDRISAAIRRAQEVAAVLDLTDDLDALLENVGALQTKAERAREEKAAKKTTKKRGRPRGRPPKRGRPEMRT